MTVKQECIGNTHTRTAPNGTVITVTIKNDPSQFELYKLLKLDVFGPEVKAKVLEVKPKEEKKKSATAKK